MYSSMNHIVGRPIEIIRRFLSVGKLFERIFFLAINSSLIGLGHSEIKCRNRFPRNICTKISLVLYCNTQL